jgi:hypothetical protein
MAIFNTVYGGEWKWKPWANTLWYRPLNWNANDLSWNWNNGTASNITWDSWWDGGCAYFNWNAYIDIPSLENTTTRTFSFWVKCASNASGDFLFAGDNSDKNLTLMASSWKINTQIWKSWIGSPTRWITNNYSTATVWDGTWHHIVVTINSNVYTTYIDGVQDNSCTWSYWTTPISVIRMWMNKNGSSDKYTGYIDTLIIEKVCWTADEVSKYYKSTKWNY